MAGILVKVTSWLSLPSRISAGNILEVVVISFPVYGPLVRIKNTRAWNLLKGLLVILVFMLFVTVLHLTTILWTPENITTIAVTALPIIFQLESRKALEQLGNRDHMPYISSLDKGRDNQGSNGKAISELVRATFEMAKVKTGALMVVGRGSSLKETERMGTEINGLVTSQLLINILERNTSLHNGAVVIRGNRIIAAACYLSLADNTNISKALGTRHRATVGVGESMGSTIIMVSEETEKVPVAEGGMLFRIPDAENLKKVLSNMKEKTVSLNRLEIWKGRLKNGKKAV